MSRIVLYDVEIPFGGDAMAAMLTQIMFPDHARAEDPRADNKDQREYDLRHRVAAE